MIRDPSDGSVKAETSSIAAPPLRTREQYGPNWGLTSLDRPERKPKPAPTKEELAEHYAKFNLGFEAKEKAE